MMKSMLKRFISAVLATALLLSVSAVAFADEITTTNAPEQVFTDMPDDWRKEAVENAVKNGLISGKGEGKVAPDDNITRAEMATIIVKALGATQESDISMFADMQDTEAWYYDWMAKAVYMNAFAGDGNNLNPNVNITFEQCFTVLSKIFGLQIRITENDAKKALMLFEDGSQVASWATKYYGAIVDGGYWTGGEKMLLTPQANITRGEFAVVMDNLVKTYISEPGQVTEVPEGNVVVRSDDVNLDGIKIKGDLIISDCVSANKVSLNDIDVDGRIVYRGCATPGWREVVNNDGNVSKVWSYTEHGSAPSGNAEDVQLLCPYISVNIVNLKNNPMYYGIKNTRISTGSI